ncbi:MAG: nucleoside deaminase [Phycisphaerales bacterium]|nr:nucleoside deaminase [Phycisphaerales bacterium]
MHSDEHWMGLAILQAQRSIRAGQSPFGAVIVRGDDLIAASHNLVWLTIDPTAHAEVTCIRNACGKLQAIKLDGCRMYTTCEPCPMCAAAIHWSGLQSVAYGATIADATDAGFTEISFPCDRLLKEGGSKVVTRTGLLTPLCAALFDEWKRASGRAY